MDVNNSTYKWEAAEHHLEQVGTPWLIALLVVTGSAVIASLLFSNFLFAIFLTLAALVVTANRLKPVGTGHYEINPEGVVAQKTFYPYSSLSSFSITSGHPENRLLLISKRPFLPLVLIPLGEEDPEIIRGVIGDFLPEGNHVEPKLYQIAERMGL